MGTRGKNLNYGAAFRYRDATRNKYRVASLSHLAKVSSRERQSRDRERYVAALSYGDALVVVRISSSSANCEEHARARTHTQNELQTRRYPRDRRDHWIDDEIDDGYAGRRDANPYDAPVRRKLKVSVIKGTFVSQLKSRNAIQLHTCR